MYHGRMKGTHFETGLKWGSLLREHGKILDSCPTFDLTSQVYDFAKECRREYEIYFPEILEEIRGIAEGNRTDVKLLQAMLFGMYCFEFTNHCTCFAISTENEILFARNSDFQVDLEKLYMNCIYTFSHEVRPPEGHALSGYPTGYTLPGSYIFQGNTTAFVEMEDGVNEHGLAVGLTFIYPAIRKPGLNAGLLVRYLLEKCRTTKEALEALHRLPLASAQTLTIADAEGEIAVAECNPDRISVIRPETGACFVAATNNFHSIEMRQYQNPEGLDDWRSEDRYQTAVGALRHHENEYSVEFAQSVLAGEYGFMCQYDRKKNADTVWSVVYDLKRKQIWRVEGNPSRKKFKEDTRMR